MTKPASLSKLVGEYITSPREKARTSTSIFLRSEETVSSSRPKNKKVFDKVVESSISLAS